MKHIIVGTAGHIDHGKTELVKALTGIDADRLKEEKERGITIDIGFAFLTMGDARFGFVDVPGHERFVKNMLAGVHGIDLVLLVVAADESIMPQTREHFDICRLLRVKSGLIAITKVDLVDEEFLQLVEEEVRDFVRGSFLDGAPVIRVSARTGVGLEELKAALVNISDRIQERQSNAVPRLPIDRVFTKRGFGTVVTGTLVSGTLREGQNVEILPRQMEATIRGLQVHNRPVEVAHAGERTAVNLQGVGVDDLQRGDVLVPPRRFRPTFMLDARLELLPTAPQPIENRTRVRFHIGTAEIMARVILLDRESLRPGDAALVQLRLERPTFAVAGDRFIIRRYSPQTTVGGGVILDPLPSKHPPFRPQSERSQTLIDRLHRLESDDPHERIAAWVDAAGPRGVTIGELAARSGWIDDEVDSIIAHLVEQRRIQEIQGQQRYYLSAEGFAELKRQMTELLEDFHRANPLLEGIPREELRNRLLPRMPADFSASLIARLVEEPEFAAERDRVRLASHQVRLSADEARQQQALLAAIRRAGYQALTLEQVAERTDVDPSLVRKLLQLLIHEGRVIRLGELIFDAELIHELIDKVRARKAVNPKLDVATFKQLAGVTRKYAIPLLEFLDRQGVTRRMGNERIIL